MYNFSNVSNFTTPIYQNTQISITDIIKNNCQHYNSFLVNTIIIFAVLYIILEVLSQIKTPDWFNDYKIRTLFYNTFGIFFCYESYFFINNFLSPSNQKYLNYFVFVLFILVVVLLLHGVYKKFQPNQKV